MKFIFFSIMLGVSIISNAATLNNYIKDPEAALLEVVYSRKMITDTTDREKRFTLDDSILRVGKTKSMFCGERKLWRDSLMKIDYSLFHSVWKATYEKDEHESGFLGGRYWAYVYKNFTNQECSEYDYFDIEYWKYSEELKTPEWTITDSVKTIIGYECIKGTTDFKGRQWTAWFTPEIPVSDGPWKLHGLPGLIMEAYDKSHDYEFEAKGIRTSGVGLVGYMEYKDYIEISRDKFFSIWWKVQHESIVAKVRAIMGDSNGRKHTTKRIPNYDREEIDYDHSLE